MTAAIQQFPAPRCRHSSISTALCYQLQLVLRHSSTGQKLAERDGATQNRGRGGSGLHEAKRLAEEVVLTSLLGRCS